MTCQAKPRLMGALFFIGLIGLGHGGHFNAEVCTSPSDTAIVVDTSGSISLENMERAKSLVIRIVTALADNPESRQGVYNAQESPKTILELDDQPPRPALIAQLEEGIKHTDDYTYLEKGIKLATTELLAHKRSHASLNLVLLTDGIFDDKDMFGYPARAAGEALEQFVNIFVVAVGEDGDPAELESLTDDIRQIYRLRDNPAVILLDDMCHLPLPPPTHKCPRQFDIFLMVDSSASMTKAGFNVAKGITRRLLRGVSTEIRQGLIQYSTEPTMHFSISDSLSAYQKDQIAKRNLTFEDGYSLTAKAISMARESLKENDRGLPRIMVILSDGQSDFPQTVVDEAQRALEMLMDIYALQFGDGDTNELEMVTDYEDRVYRIGDAAGPHDLVTRMLMDICPPPPPPPEEVPEACLNPLKMIVLLESSQEMGATNFNNGKEIVRTLAKWARGTQKNKIALALFGQDVTPVIELAEDLSVYKTDSRIRHVKFQASAKVDIGEGVMWAHQHHEGEADKSPTVMVILSTGSSDFRIPDILKSIRAREAGIKIFAISFGNQEGLTHLKRLAGRLSKVWNFDRNCLGTRKIVREMSLELCPKVPISYNLPTPCAPECDLVVVLDTSRSLNLPNFKNIKRFTSLLMSKFPTTTDSLVSVGTAGRMAKIWLPIRPKYRSQIVAVAVMGIPFAGGDLALADTIQLVRKSLYGGSYRYFVPKTLLFINNEATSYASGDVGEAHRAEDNRINVVTITIGNNTDHATLEMIAGSSSDAFFARDHESLLTLLEPVSRHICNPKWIREPATCAQPTDIVFVVDSSNGAGQEHFRYNMEFVARLLPAYLANGRVGVITYGGSATQVIHLTSQGTELQMQDRVLKAPFTGGDASATNALSDALKMFGFPRTCRQGKQPKASTVILLSQAVMDLEQAVSQSQQIRKKWTNTLVWGIGNQMSLSAVERLAGGTKDANLVRNHLELFNSVVNVGQKACKEPPVLPSCMPVCKLQNDIVFILDGSGGSGPGNFEFTKEFVAGILPAFVQGGRVGVLIYGGGVTEVIHLSAQRSVEQMQDMVLNAGYSGGTANAATAIDRARIMLGVGPNPCDVQPAPKGITVVLICHLVSDLGDAGKMLQRIRALRLHTFVIAIGNQLSKSQVERLAGSLSEAHFENDPEELQTSFVASGKRLCEQPYSPFCCGEWTDFKYVPESDRSKYTAMDRHPKQWFMGVPYYCRVSEAGTFRIGTLYFDDKDKEAYCAYSDGNGYYKKVYNGQVMLYRQTKTMSPDGTNIPANALAGGISKDGEVAYVGIYECPGCKGAPHSMAGTVTVDVPHALWVADVCARGTRDSPDFVIFVC